MSIPCVVQAIHDAQGRDGVDPIMIITQAYACFWWGGGQILLVGQEEDDGLRTKWDRLPPTQRRPLGSRSAANAPGVRSPSVRDPAKMAEAFAEKLGAAKDGVDMRCYFKMFHGADFPNESMVFEAQRCADEAHILLWLRWKPKKCAIWQTSQLVHPSAAQLLHCG